MSYDKTTRSFYQSVGLVPFDVEVCDGMVYLVYNGNYYIPVRGRFQDVLPDSDGYASLVAQPRESVLGLETYCTLRMNSYVPYAYGLKSMRLRKARYVWIPDGYDQDLQPPLDEYTVIVRGEEHVKDPKTYWLDMNRMASMAERACVSNYLPVTKEWIDELISPAKVEDTEYLEKVEEEPESDFFTSIDHVSVYAGEAKQEAIRACARAVTVMTQVPWNLTEVYVDVTDLSTDLPLDYLSAVKMCKHTRSLVAMEESQLGIFTSFQRADECEARMRDLKKDKWKMMVVLSEAVNPSPSGYYQVAAYRGRVHTSGFRMRNYFTWLQETSVFPDMFIDFLRPDEVYAANCKRAVSHMRALWNMGYKNFACTKLQHIEHGFIPHTYKSVQLVDDVVSVGYKSYVDLYTGKRFELTVKRLDNASEVQTVWTVKRGTCILTGGEICGRARRVLLKHKGTEAIYAWLIMRSQMLKLFTEVRGVSRMANVIVQVTE